MAETNLDHFLHASFSNAPMFKVRPFQTIKVPKVVFVFVLIQFEYVGGSRIKNNGLGGPLTFPLALKIMN